MLTLLDSTPVTWERVTFDEHVPFVVDFEPEVSYSDCVLWRTGTDRSLLQLWCHQDSGQLLQAELVLVDSRRVRSLDELPALPRPEIGLPVADLGDAFVPDPAWTIYPTMEEQEPFDLLVGPDSVQLDLGGACERCLATERVRFGFDGAGRLTRLELGPLGEEERTTLADHLGRLAQYQGKPARGS